MAKNIRKKISATRKKAGKEAGRQKKKLTSANNPLANEKVAKTARGRRELRKREAKVIENAKNMLIIRGGRTSPELTQLLHDVHDLKKPFSQALLRKHVDLMNPFECEDRLVQMCNKQDAGLFCLGSSSKKRPHRLVLGRIFNEALLDMTEFRLSEFGSFDGKSTLPVLGAKPLVVFQGACWDESPAWTLRKSLLLDAFRGASPDQINLRGLENVIVFTGVEESSSAKKKSASGTAAKPEDLSSSGGTGGSTATATAEPSYKVLFRHYKVKMSKSAENGVPRVGLSELGPRFSMHVDREKEADPAVLKQALKVPDGEKKKKVKNVETNALGQTLGRIHLGRQDFDKIYSVHMGKKVPEVPEVPEASEKKDDAKV